MGLQGRLDALGAAAWGDTDAVRLGNRLGKYRDGLLTFVDHRDGPPDNNHGERILRPAVLMRKASLWDWERSRE
jgi:transposase